MNKVLLGVGTNVGSREKNIEKTIDLIEADDNIEIYLRSSVYESKAFGVTDQQNFFNLVLYLYTNYSPLQLYRRIKEIEVQVGRISRERWGPREIDLDILFFNNDLIHSELLTIPHEGCYKRDFVLVPIYELLEKEKAIQNDFGIRRVNLEKIKKNILKKIDLKHR
ncbi:MAG: 2-amino-4-hydroxy-6-hydroxymethyldihydropteridine diphosphokinase [Melioribacteraceae bacterium]|nr:2-amino-4-hydroxy-6-hydroxymethyldihydropteridine diphosphokinase [Melioribacteraceae bacterium]MCF8265953.1 2-amino-4-hydroxy-6-hydroxymethyldihydropteridine diphosphokinase [Melioribacteraceae bacterium]MCF8432737.1 2-amino-4-hydroxy-6-hydroxymethyldihydropteridine diphosphokinase [Melioribacteraceae bacterium]